LSTDFLVWKKLLGRLIERENKMKQNDHEQKIKGVTTVSEQLLYASCRSAFSRVQSQTEKAYIGVKIQWDSAKEMKEALMNNIEFWKTWTHLTKTYIESGKRAGLRPTLDRVESNASIGGHYFEKNIRPLTKSENSKLGRAISNQALLIKNNKPTLLIQSDSLRDTHSKLKVLTKGNIHNIKRNTGEFLDIGNEYSVLLQSLDKNKIDNFVGNRIVGKYEARIYKTLFLVDYYTGKEYPLRVKEEKLIFDKFYLQDSEGLL